MSFERDTSVSVLNRDSSGHYLGLRRDMEDRSVLRAGQCPKPMLGAVDIASLPESMSVSKWMQIEHQGPVGSCQGHAQTTCCELAYFHQTGKYTQFNRMFAYLASQKVDGINGDNGSTMTGGAKSCSTNGLPLESDWPYIGYYPRGGWRVIESPIWEKAKKTLLAGYRVLESYDEVLQWLANKVGGVAIGIDWNNSMEPDANGCIRSYRRGGGGHALALLDWNKKYTDPRGLPYIEMFNSWGRDYGVDGRAFILPAIVDYWCKNMDVIGYGLLEGSEIKPKKFDWKNGSFYV